MSVNVGCPNCSRKLRIEDEFVGKKVRCPDCKTVFIGEPSAPAAEAAITTSTRGKPDTPKKDDEPEDKPRKKGSGETGIEVTPSKKKPKRKDDEEDDEDEEDGEEDDEDGVKKKKAKRLKPKDARAGWRAMRLALSIVIWGVNTLLTVLACLFVGIILLMILGMIAAKSGSFGFLGVVSVLGIILYVLCTLGALASLILNAVGHGFFWQVPNQPGSGLRPMAIVTMSLFFLYILLGCGGYGGACVLGSVFGRLVSLLYLGILVLEYLAVFAWFFVFWFFMRFICLEVRNRPLGRFPIYFMIVFPVYNFVGPILLVLLFLLAGASVGAIGYSDPSSALNGASAMFVVMAVAALAFLIIDWCLLLWSSFILQNIREAVDRESRR